MRWTGSRNVPQDEVHVLLRASQREAIVADLILEDWQHAQQLPNENSITDTILESRNPNQSFKYLRLSSEESYQLSIECAKVEVPDLSPRNPVLLEEEYDRGPYSRFAPPVISKISYDVLPSPQHRAKLHQLGIAICVPTVEDHMNALLHQWRRELLTNQKSYVDPRQQLKHLI